MYVGRIGALAVALGIGTALAVGQAGSAQADTSGAAASSGTASAGASAGPAAKKAVSARAATGRRAAQKSPQQIMLVLPAHNYLTLVCAHAAAAASAWLAAVIGSHTPPWAVQQLPCRFNHVLIN